MFQDDTLRNPKAMNHLENWRYVITTDRVTHQSSSCILKMLKLVDFTKWKADEKAIKNIKAGCYKCMYKLQCHRLVKIAPDLASLMTGCLSSTAYAPDV